MNIDDKTVIDSLSFENSLSRSTYIQDDLRRVTPPGFPKRTRSPKREVTVDMLKDAQDRVVTLQVPNLNLSQLNPNVTPHFYPRRI